MFKVNELKKGIFLAMWGASAIVGPYSIAVAAESADETTAEQPASAVKEEDVQQLANVVVTAQYRAQKIQDIPVAISAIKIGQ